MGAVVLCLALCLAVPSTTWAFKEQDFKKCGDNKFCERLRGQPGPNYAIVPSSISVEGSSLIAELRNQDDSKSFALRVTAHTDIFRVHVSEVDVDRFELTDILQPSLPALVAVQHDTDGKASQLRAGGNILKLQYEPFKVELPGLIELNSRSMFHMEHRRERGENDTHLWEESFKGHADSKPKGPQSISLDMRFPSAMHVYGIPEHATELSLKPTAGPGITSEPYRLYNLDVFEYLSNSPFGLYGSIPYMVALGQGRAVGAFWLNAAEMYIDVEKGQQGIDTQWMVESGVVDLFLLTGPTPAKLSQQYSQLTGTTAMPQMFSIGYHQCRWNYKDEADVAAVNEGFDEHEMPCDVIWLDIEHTDGKRYMTWDASKFPTPQKMLQGVAEKGRKMVTIVDPHVKRDNGYQLHSLATKKRYYVRNAKGDDFEGWCWPGSSSYLDVVSPDIRAWWATHFSTAAYAGSTGDLYIWNDMNEPSVFNGPEITMPKDALHLGTIEHRDIHNAYGYYYHLATADGLARRGEQERPPHGDRPFVLSRAFFAGTQRVGPIWTGDNTATWEQLKVSVPMLLALNVAGLPNAGADVGGFFGNPDAELAQRWYQAAVFYPFLRGHAHLDTKRREPWLFGDKATGRIRTALRERYALLPYLYTLFRAANETGDPIMRPMFHDFPEQPELYALENQFMFGPAILAAPVLDEAATSVDIYLPEGEVFYKQTGQQLARLQSGGPYAYPVTMDSIPWLYRGGHIVARRERPRRSTKSQASDPYTLIVALDVAGQAAKGRLYIDDGRSYAFLEGQYIDADITFEGGTTLKYVPRHAGLQLGLLFERVVVLGYVFKSPTAAYSARVEKTGAVVEVTREAFGGSTERTALVYRMPATPVRKAWTLTLHEA
eukprot:jgi/Ulvmu1/1250/UM109_0048.1